MKLHQHLVEAVVEALEDIFDRGFYADKVIEKKMKQQRKWGGRDRRYFAETVYEMVRWKRLLQELAQSDDFMAMWAVYSLQKGLTLPSWAAEFEVSSKQLEKRMDAIQDEAILESVPSWLYGRGQRELPESWHSILQAMNQPAPVYLRVNPLKATLEEVQAALLADEIEAEPLAARDQYPLTLRLKERKNVFATKAFKLGLFEVQDASSQRVAPLVDVAPGMRVVDACAGAGGKSLHLAGLMKNKGKIIAMDIHEWKLKELKTRAARGGIDIIETRLIEGSKSIKRLENSFDRVLLDVPCSGLGVLRRNPDTKWKLTSEEVVRLQGLQQQILQDYSVMCKVGGRLVYATCSILPSENRQQVDKFLAANSNWELVSDLSLRPDLDGSDGFYAAALVRKS